MYIIESDKYKPYKPGKVSFRQKKSPNSYKCRIFFFFLFRAAPVACGSLQARGRVGATVASLCMTQLAATWDP